MYKIEKQIPIPIPKTFMLRELEVTDSIKVPVETDIKERVRARIGGWVFREKLDFPDKKFITRWEVNGFRVWRTK